MILLLVFDVLVVGGGGAGMQAAIEAAKYSKLSVGLISKTSPLRSTTGCTGGGINAVLNPTDSFEKHIHDTLSGGSFLGDHDAIEFLAFQAPHAIMELAHYGTPFFRDDNGFITQRKGAGASAPRCCLTLGHAIAHALYSQILRSDITELSNFYLLEIVVENNCIQGVVAYDSVTGKITPITAKAIVVATGGYGRVYWSRTTNPLGSTGDGIAACFNIGIPLKDPEFIQFHPTALAESGILISEGARGEGGYLLNNQNKRFMSTYAPQKMELTTRDLVSFAIENEIQEGRGFGSGITSHILLDLRHLDPKIFQGKLSQVYNVAKSFAFLDPSKHPLPIRPSCHFTIGGIDVINYQTCATNRPGVFAAGECACISIHGANRLGGNALSEAIVFGKIAGGSAAAFAQSVPLPSSTHLYDATHHWEEQFNSALRKSSPISITQIRNHLSETMYNKVGIIRNEQGLRQALSEIQWLDEQYCLTGLSDTEPVGNTSFIHYVEVGNMLVIAKALALGALHRRETRGCHFRSDYSKKNDASFCNHTIIAKNNNRFEISYRPITITNHVSTGAGRNV